MPARLLRRRPVVAVATAATALLTLTACQKPVPLVTVTSGTSTAYGATTCYADKGQQLSADCQNAAPVGTVKVRGGATIGISVDPKLASAGWVVAINGQQVANEVIHREYFAFDVSPNGISGGNATLQVAVGPNAQDTSTVRGLWKFTLIRD